MSPRFAIGEIAIIAEGASPFRGLEVTITSERMEILKPNGVDFDWGYAVDIPGHPVDPGFASWCAPEWTLRKKKPPEELNKKVSWADVPFFDPTKTAVLHKEFEIMNDQAKEMGTFLIGALESIRERFKSEMNITLVVRNPAKPLGQGVLYLSDEKDIEAVVEVLTSFDENTDRISALLTIKESP